MTITSHLFEAFLKCSTKCFLLSLGEAHSENVYATWAKTHQESYRNQGLRRLMEGVPSDGSLMRPLDAGCLKTTKWGLAVGLLARAQDLESCKQTFQTEIARKCKARLEKNRSRLFTFLDYDGVPWNNNNAEHAIKAIALLRRDFSGLSTEKGIREYSILLSICETCKCKGVSFLEFLQSGERDIDVFAEFKWGHARRADASVARLERPLTATACRQK